MRAQWGFLGSLLIVSSLLRAAAQVAPPAPAGPAQATEAARYTTERDSLWQRAARVRARTQGRIAQFRTSFASLRGTRRKVVSFGQLKVKKRIAGAPIITRVKRQIFKHKTTGSELEKIYYYGAGNRLLLAEYYQEQQLVRLELHEYPLREGNEVETAFRHSKWLLGDYLQLITHVQGDKKSVRQQYYLTAPRR